MSILFVARVLIYSHCTWFRYKVYLCKRFQYSNAIFSIKHLCNDKKKYIDIHPNIVFAAPNPVVFLIVSLCNFI